MVNGKSDHALLQDTRDRLIRLEGKFDGLNDKVRDIHSAIIEKKEDKRFWESQFFQIVGFSGLISLSTILAVLQYLGLLVRR